MTLKDDAKFKGKLTRDLKNNINNLVNLHVSSRKSKNLDFDGLLLSKAYGVLDEIVQKSSYKCLTPTSYKCNCVDGMKLIDGICTGIKFNVRMIQKHAFADVLQNSCS